MSLRDQLDRLATWWLGEEPKSRRTSCYLTDFFVKGWEQQTAIFNVLKERRRQDEKWGSQRKLSGYLWTTILTEEIGEVAQEVFDVERSSDVNRAADARDRLYVELSQVAAVAVAWMEAIDIARDSAGTVVD